MGWCNRRVRKIVYGEPNVVTRYCYDGAQVIVEYDVSNNPRYFIYGSEIDEPIFMTGGGSSCFYHYDGLGSVAALSDGQGNIVERYSYDVFGKPTIYDENGSLITDSNVGNPYMFTGRRYDSETGLYYYRSRYYKSRKGPVFATRPTEVQGWVEYLQLCPKQSY